MRYIVGVMKCSLVRGTRGDEAAFTFTVNANTRKAAAIKTFPALRRKLEKVLIDPTIKFVDILVGSTTTPSEAPTRMMPFRFSVETGCLLDGTHIIAD